MCSFQLSRLLVADVHVELDAVRSTKFSKEFVVVVDCWEIDVAGEFNEFFEGSKRKFACESATVFCPYRCSTAVYSANAHWRSLAVSKRKHRATFPCEITFCSKVNVGCKCICFNVVTGVCCWSKCQREFWCRATICIGCYQCCQFIILVVWSNADGSNVVAECVGTCSAILNGRSS